MKKMFFAILMVLVASLVSAQTYGSWTAKEAIDPMTDSNDVYFYNRELTGGSIVVWYENGKLLYIAIDFNKYMDNEPIKVSVRYDSGNVQDMTLLNSSDGTTVLTRDETMLNELVSSSRFIIRGLDYRGAAKIMIFETAGLAQAIATHVK